MSSYATTATPPPKKKCDPETIYSMDYYIPTYTQEPRQPHQDQLQRRQGPCNNEKSNMAQSEFECFHQAVASTLPLENLSLNTQMSNNWSLELEGPYQSDMSFLFTCNELGVNASESSSSSSSAAAEHFHPQSIKGVEQYRRFSLEEADTLGHMMSFYQIPAYNNRERSSMPNVFEHFPAPVPQQQGQLSWQQSTLLQKRPDYQHQNGAAAIKKHAKKRSLADQVLNEEYMPSIVSSLSEPIPTSQQWMLRKRTKSTLHGNTDKTDHPSAPTISTIPTTTTAATELLNSSEYIVPSSTPTESDRLQHHEQQQHQDYITPSDPMLHYESTTVNDSNQLLAAYPRRQKSRYDGDNYTPKWVRFTGHLKEGYCDSCQPGKWLQLKNSAYWYHKQFYHGISSVSGKSFIKPLEQRMGKGDMLEGLCHQCHRFVSACNGKKKNSYMLWYRHAHKCHLYDKPKATTVKKCSKIIE